MGSDEPPERAEVAEQDGESAGDEPDLTSMNLRTSVLTLAFPAAMRMGLHSVVEMVSLMIVGGLGAEAIAAVGVGKRVVQMANAVFKALSVGSTAVVARYVGAKDREGADRVVSQSILFSVAVGCMTAILGVFFARQMMTGMMIFQEVPDAAVIDQGVGYMRYLSAFYILALPLFMSNAVMQGAGDMKTPLYLMAYMNITNLICAYVFVNGVGPFPTMGVAGVGLAAGWARGSAGLIAVWILATRRTVIGLNLRECLKVDWTLFRSIVGVGFPAAVENFVRRGSQILYTMIIAYLGTVAMAANSIAMSIQSFSFMPGFGFGLAGTALVGQNLGAKQPERAEDAGFECLKWALGCCILMGAVFFVAPQLITHLYTDDVEVMQLTISCLRVIALAMPFLAMIQVFSGGLRGAGDTTFVMLATLIGNWGIRLLGSYILGVYFGLGLIGVWIAMAGDQMGRGLLLMWRFKKGRWKTIQLIDQKDEQQAVEEPAGADIRRPTASGRKPAGQKSPSPVRVPSADSDDST